MPHHHMWPVCSKVADEIRSHEGLLDADRPLVRNLGVPHQHLQELHRVGDLEGLHWSGP